MIDERDGNVTCGCHDGMVESAAVAPAARRRADEEAGAEANPQKKHQCPDCSYCQWCSDDRCRLCRTPGHKGKKLSLAEQVALFEAINSGRMQGDDSPE